MDPCSKVQALIQENPAKLVPGCFRDGAHLQYLIFGPRAAIRTLVLNREGEAWCRVFA